MPTAKARMLIVEDEPTIRNLLTQIFTGLGHPVRAAQDGFAALEELRKETPDILLSDLNMPRMSGFELLSVVRRKLPQIFVIASSGAFAGDAVPTGIAADAFHEKAAGLSGLFQIVKSASRTELVRPGSSDTLPIWISPFRDNLPNSTQVLLSCPECLRSFSLAVGEADFVIHQTACVYCHTVIHYATVQPMNPDLPHNFQPWVAGQVAGQVTVRFQAESEPVSSFHESDTAFRHPALAFDEPALASEGSVPSFDEPRFFLEEAVLSLDDSILPLGHPALSRHASPPDHTLPDFNVPPPTPALLYTVITQTANEVQDIHNAPAVSMARYLVEHDRMHILPTLSVYGERGPDRNALRILYMNAGAFALWEEMGMHPTVVGAQHRPARTAQLTYGVPFSE